MQISVVIPVYNAAAFVREAVESALAQPETAEVVLVEDGSPDDSLAVCETLAAEYERVHLFRHPNGENRGAGASRNLGILNSRFEYIAFLDADDFYLPGRFSTARAVLAADPTLDGVLEDRPLDGLVVKRTVFERAGLFDEHLRLHQDTAMMYKLAGVARLAPGSLDQPVAMRRVHAHNRITAPRPPADVYEKRMLLFDTVWQWARRNLPPEKTRLLLELYLRAVMLWPDRDEPPALQKARARLLLAKRAFRAPGLLRESLYWLSFLPKASSRMITGR